MRPLQHRRGFRLADGPIDGGGGKYWPVIWLPLALVLVLPFGWENALWAFQSLFYFQLAFSLLTIWLLGLSKPLSPRWRLGVIAAVASIFTTGSGFVSVVAVTAIVGLDLLKDRPSWRRHWPTLAVCGIIAVVGVLLLPDEKEHYAIRAHSVGEYFTALGNYLSWPTGLFPWLALLNLFPLFMLGWIYYKEKEQPQLAARMILGVGIWVLLLALAAAYARGVGGKPPVWRYMDTACFLMIADFLSIAMLLGHYRNRLKFTPLWFAVFVTWSVPSVWSLWLLTDRAWTVAIPLWSERQEARLESARAFMATDDDKVFLKQDPFYIPHPYVPFLVFLMRQPHIREALPACVREPLKVEPGTNSTEAFVINGCHLEKPDPQTEKCWGSYNAMGATAQGTFESEPIKPGRFSRLEMPIAGDLGKHGLTLELMETRSGKIISINPEAIAGGRWLNAYVRMPATEFKIVAKDESATGWFAFKAPREIAWLSYRATQLVLAWKIVLVASGLALLLGIGSLLKSCHQGGSNGSAIP